MEFVHHILQYAKHKVEELIYRDDELKNNEGQFDEKDGSGGGKSGIQLKIVMTREEAVRLLSKCRDRGGSLQFKDVDNELVRLPNNRLQLVSTTTTTNNSF
ncbi:hypothetical protein ACS0TY_011716 [Phlomoides rotata]